MDWLPGCKLVFSPLRAHPSRNSMKHLRVSYALVLLLSGCTALESQSEFSTGRQALLRGEPDNALA